MSVCTASEIKVIHKEKKNKQLKLPHANLEQKVYLQAILCIN